MKYLVIIAGLLFALPSMSVTVQESGQYKRLSAKYTSDSKNFFDRNVKVATLLVKCHPSKIVTFIGSEGTKQNQPFACSTADGDNEHMFFAYAKKSSRICRELSKYHSDTNPDGEVECYMMLEKLSVDFILLNEKLEIVRDRIDGCWIKEFMPKEKYESIGAPGKKGDGGVTESSKKSEMIMPAISNSVSIAMFKADRTSCPVKYYAIAKLGHYYNYDFGNCKDSHWSIDLDCKDINGNEGSFHGYVAKKCDLGKAVLNLLKDGKEHAVTVVLAHPRNAESSDHCEILMFEDASQSSQKSEIPHGK